MKQQSRRITTGNVNNFLLGFDKMFNDMLDRPTVSNNYPPHNVYKLSKDDPYSDMVIEIALAGMRKEDLDITLTDDDTLRVEYDSEDPMINDDFEYIHRGIANRKFVLEWRMNKDLEVEEAGFDNGILRIKIANHAGRNHSTQKIEIK